MFRQTRKVGPLENLQTTEPNYPPAPMQRATEADSKLNVLDGHLEWLMRGGLAE